MDNVAVVNALTTFVNKVLSGNIPNEVKPFFFGANLTALNKKTGGVRPIAVGNTLRRLSAKCAGYCVKDARTASYRNIQLGYGTPRGAEAAAHAVRQYVCNNNQATRVMFKIDFNNAFNSLNRETILKNVASNNPSIFPFTSAAYGQSSFLFFGDRIILSKTGAQQGDPEGSPLFADTVQPIANEVTCEVNIWYLDDANLADEFPVVLENFVAIQRAALQIGLTINPSKCELIFLGDPDPALRNQILSAFREVCPSVQVTDKSDLVVLGAPIGFNAIEKCLEEKFCNFEKMELNLKSIDAHYALFLLKNCFRMPKFLYYLRASPCFLFDDIM